MPATGTPEPGGLLWDETIELIKTIYYQNKIVAVDVVEHAPIANVPAYDFVTAKLCYHILIESLKTSIISENLMNIEQIKEWIAERNPEALLADGFEDAIIGVAGQYGSNMVVIYDKDKCIKILAEKFAQDEDCEDPYLEAADYFGYNVECAYVGENTPIFMTGIFQ